MKKEIYYCDFCKKELKEDELINLYVDLRHYEICSSCYDKAYEYLEQYNKEYNKLQLQFKKQVTELIKGE